MTGLLSWLRSRCWITRKPSRCRTAAHGRILYMLRGRLQRPRSRLQEKPSSARRHLSVWRTFSARLQIWMGRISSSLFACFSRCVLQAHEDRNPMREKPVDSKYRTEGLETASHGLLSCHGLLSDMGCSPVRSNLLVPGRRHLRRFKTGSVTSIYG
jgi:hypothetical protein